MSVLVVQALLAVLSVAAASANLPLLALVVLFALRGLAVWQLQEDAASLPSPWAFLLVALLSWPWSFFLQPLPGLLLGLALDTATTVGRWVWGRWG